MGTNFVKAGQRMNKTIECSLARGYPLGKEMHELAEKLFPICRSISGEGFRQSLHILDQVMGGGLYKNSLH